MEFRPPCPDLDVEKAETQVAENAIAANIATFWHACIVTVRLFLLVWQGEFALAVSSSGPARELSDCDTISIFNCSKF